MLKKIIIAALVGSVSSAYAAEDNVKISLGIIGEVARADLPKSSRDLTDAKNKGAISYGLDVGIASSAPLGLQIQSGIMLLRHRQKWENSTFAYTRSQWKARVPVEVQMNLTSLLTLGLGPYLSFPLGSASNNFSVGDSSLVSYDTDNSVGLELGLTTSARLNIPISSLAFFVEGNYSKGLTDLSNDDDTRSLSEDVSGIVGIVFDF